MLTRAVSILALIGVLVLVALAVSRVVRSSGIRPPTRLPRPALPPRSRRGRYDWERRQDRVVRRLKGVHKPAEDRDGIIRFIGSRRGVEAYIEPKTMISPLSVVLVAEDGEWVRFHLADDAFIRELSRARSLPVFDAERHGYPRRMRDYRPRQPGGGSTDPPER